MFDVLCRGADGMTNGTEVRLSPHVPAKYMLDMFSSSVFELALDDDSVKVIVPLFYESVTGF